LETPVTNPPAASDSTLTDRSEIEDLAVRYLDTLDGHDVEGFVGCFADGAEIREAGQSFSGLGQIREFVETRGGYAFHMSTDATITVSGDRAERRSRWLAFPASHSPDGPSTGWFGRGRDEVVRTSEGWRIAVREITVLQGVVPDDV